MIDATKKSWNARQKLLRAALSNPLAINQAIDLFLIQHAWVHSKNISGIDCITFEDQLWTGLSDVDARKIPNKSSHSILWCIWHMTRCEDVTMNMLVQKEPQILSRGNWVGPLGVKHIDAGNGMNEQEMHDFNQVINIEALKAYRYEVGIQTGEIVKQLKIIDIKRKPDQVAVVGLIEEGAVLESERWLVGLLGEPQRSRHPLDATNSTFHGPYERSPGNQSQAW